MVKLKISNKFLLFLLGIISLFSEGIMGLYFIIPFILLLFLLYYKTLLILVKQFIATLCGKFLLTFIAFIMFGFILNLLLINISATKFFIAFFGGYLLHFIACFLLGCLLAYKVNEQTLIKFFITVLYIFLFAGIIEFIMYKFSISGFEIINFLCSGRESSTNYKWSVFPRIQSFFAEPSHYAWFLACNIPFAVIIFNDNNILISKKKIINKIIRKGLLFSVLISLFLTLSPINIILGFVISLLSLLVNMNYAKKKYIFLLFLPMLLITVFLSCFILKIMELPFVSRIIDTFPIIFNLNALIIVEPSLAARIISYMHMFKIALLHPLCGVSPGNISSSFVNLLLSSNIQITPELMSLTTAEKINLNPSIFFKLISENGFIGITLFLLFLFFLYKKNIFIERIIPYKQTKYLKIVSATMITYFFLMFYDSQLYNHYFWLLFGTVIGSYIKFIKIKKGYSV